MIDEILKTEAALDALGVNKRLRELSHNNHVFSGVRTINGIKPDDTGDITLALGGVGVESDPLSLHLDQSTPQTVINGAPYIPAINGSASANGVMTLQGTTSSTRTTSYLNLQPNGGFVGIGTATPESVLHVQSTYSQFKIIDYLGASRTSPNIIAGYVGNTMELGDDTRGNTISGGGWVSSINKMDGLQTRYSTISGGYDNYIDGAHSSEALDAAASTIGGGAHHFIRATHSVIAGGSSAIVHDGAPYSTIGGGIENESSGSYGSILGGHDNTVSAAYATVGGGQLNVASGQSAVIPGGDTNTASGNYSSIMGGRYNTASGVHASVLGGIYNQATGISSMASGRRAYATADGAVLLKDNINDTVTNSTLNHFMTSFSGGHTFDGGPVTFLADVTTYNLTAQTLLSEATSVGLLSRMLLNEPTTLDDNTVAQISSVTGLGDETVVNGGFETHGTNGGITSGVMTVNVARSSNVATVEATAHGLVNTNVVTIAGCTDATFNATGVAVTRVDDNHFTYSSTGDDKVETEDLTGCITTDVFGTWIETITAGEGLISRESTEKQAGDHALRIDRTGDTANGSPNVHQTIAVTAGADYILSCYTRGDGSNGGRYAIYDDINKHWIVAPAFTNKVSVNYTRFTKIFHTPNTPEAAAPCTSIIIYFYSPYLINSYAYFDAISCRELNVGSSKAMVLQGISGQAENILEIQNSEGAVMSAFGPSGQLKLLETGSTPTKYTTIQAGDQTADITLTLPTAVAGSTGDVLTSTNAGVLSWATPAVTTVSKDIVCTAPLTVNGGANLDNVLPGADADVTLALTQNLPGINKHLRLSIFKPNALGITTNTVIGLITLTDAAITITNIEVSTSSASYEVAGDLKFADARIGLANATVVETFDTSSGVRSDSSMSGDATIPSGKFVYLQFDSAPNASMTDVTFDICYDYD